MRGRLGEYALTTDCRWSATMSRLGYATVPPGMETGSQVPVESIDGMASQSLSTLPNRRHRPPATQERTLKSSPYRWEVIVRPCGEVDGHN
jgi:hypothetical protein